MILTLYTDDGEQGLTVQGPSLAACITLTYSHILSAAYTGDFDAIPIPPLELEPFRAWCFEHLDGATLEVS